MSNATPWKLKLEHGERAVEMPIDASVIRTLLMEAQIRDLRVSDLLALLLQKLIELDLIDKLLPLHNGAKN